MAREAARLAQSAVPAAPPASSGSWISRHPVAFWTLVGAGVGVVGAFAATSGDCDPRTDSDCSAASFAAVNPLLGAGVGALVGLIVKLVR